jgi:hypothetical protein
MMTGGNAFWAGFSALFGVASVAVALARLQ